VDAGTGSIRFIDTELSSDFYTYYSAEGVFRYDKTTDDLRRMPDENWTTADVATAAGLRRDLLNLELNATETVTTHGTTAIRYSVVGLEDPDSEPSNTASGQITVTEDGYIAEYNITRGTEGSTRRTMYELSAFGNATVPRPAWVPDE
jgi:hypothetical protein